MDSVYEAFSMILHKNTVKGENSSSLNLMRLDVWSGSYLNFITLCWLSNGYIALTSLSLYVCLYVTQITICICRTLGFHGVWGEIKGHRETTSMCLSSPCVCVSSGPGPGAGDSSAEGARATRWAEEEALWAGWGSRGLGPGRGGWGQRTATIHWLYPKSTGVKSSTVTKNCLLFLHRHRLKPATFSHPPPLLEDQLLSASFYLYTHFSPLFSSLSLFVCYLSQIKGASFLNLLLHPCPEAPSTKGFMTRRRGHRREEQLDLRGTWNNTAQLHSLTLPTASSTGLCRWKAAMKLIRSAGYLSSSSVSPSFNDGDGESPRRRYKNKFYSRHPRMHCTRAKLSAEKRGRSVTVCATPAPNSCLCVT